MKLALALLLCAGCSTVETTERRDPAKTRAAVAPVPDVRPTAPKATGSKAALVAIPNARMFEGMLVGGHPSAEQLRQAKDAGYRTIINLQLDREPDVAEERALAEELGFRYVAIPTPGAAGMTQKYAVALDEAIRNNPQPTIVHCASGNRVGALFALRAYYVQGKQPDVAMRAGQESGVTSLQPVIRRILGL